MFIKEFAFSLEGAMEFMSSNLELEAFGKSFGKVRARASSAAGILTAR
jgi:hypothetical protein